MTEEDSEPAQVSSDNLPFQKLPCFVEEDNWVEIPEEIDLLLPWLKREDDFKLDCLGVITPEGGMRIIPKTPLVRERIDTFEREMRENPVGILEMFTYDNRLRFARYLAFSWHLTLGHHAKYYNIGISEPSNAIAADTRADIIAIAPSILEIHCQQENLTTLDTETRDFAKNVFQKYFENLTV